MNQSPQPPDFFIIGAPKCGTTALSEYLRAHPNIFMSYPKEPSFLASDMPQFHAVHSMAEYLGLFSVRSSDHTAAGEASVWYLYSDTALREIRKLNPDARIIIMLRHPISFLISYHAHLHYSFTEDRDTLEAAWLLQAERAEGKSIPKKCRSPQSLQYGEMASFGARVERVFNEFPRNQILCLFQEDFSRNPKKTYQDVLSFLGVLNDFQTSFPRVNQAKHHRSDFLGRMILAPPAPLKQGWRMLKRLGGQRIIRLPELLLRRNAVISKKQLPDVHFQQLVIDTLKSDIRHLETILDRNLDNWLSPLNDSPRESE